MPLDKIEIRGARQHNLKNIDLILPARPAGGDHRPVGQRASRRLPSTRSTPRASGATSNRCRRYARQFLGQMDKPDVEYISGLSPAISIDQKGASHNPRSTVGTVTEIYDYLRLLFARIGHPHCPKCHRPIQQQTVRADHRRRAGHARGRADHGPGAAGRGPQGRVPVRSSTTSARPASCACASTARSATCATRSSSRRTRSTRSRWWSTAWWCSRAAGRQVAHRRLGRAGAEARLGPGHHQRARAGRRAGDGHAVLRAASPVRTTARRWRRSSRAASRSTRPRRLPDLHRPGHPAGGRPRPGAGQQGPELAQGAIAAWGKAGWNGNSYYKSLLESVAALLRLLDDHADPRPEARAHRRRSCTARAASASCCSYQSKSGRSREYRAALRGHHPQHRAALQRDRERVHSRGPAEVHGAATVPDVQGRAAEARGRWR